ncbi:TetR family transcriptional regulator [Mycobacterium sp. E1386]|uniref:TetR/AcrR family transcriptional regulator n=1 Tax=Mycobacterium sp. E1386 TaxID=1834126 RepID=UPI0007FCF557|nr:TetR/AcrR family transcriptional regulator [Mycobacterium sp. E1386]OBI30353.1 TetR family transcriptional regulator [Mycobacterium sp. E1386]
MRSHGWAGNAPASDEEAIDRILDVADEIIAEQGFSMRLTDVARTLGVTRQTVYRYFPGTEALMIASAMRSAHGFLDQLAEHISGLTEPAAALVEGVAFAVESLAGERQIERLLRSGAPEGHTVSLTSDTARAFSRSMLHRLDVDWDMHGFDEAALDELAEMGLRTLHSILVDPGQPHRDGIELRRFIARWLGPAIIYRRLAQVVDALTYGAAPIRQP